MGLLTNVSRNVSDTMSNASTNETGLDVNEEANELINAASNALANPNDVAEIQEQREALINYCYQHADRPNPVDDLIDKGFLPPSFKGETCISIKQAYENEKNEEIISQHNQQEAKNKENQANIDRYHKCLQNKTNDECLSILDNNDGFISYNDCLLNRSTSWEECQNILIGNKTN